MVDIMQEPKPYDHRFINNGGGIAYFVHKIDHSPTARVNDPAGIAEAKWHDANACDGYNTDKKTGDFQLQRGLQVCKDPIEKTSTCA